MAWERPKDPTEVVDYGHDWATDLGDDTISTSTWTAIDAAGTAKVSDSFAGSVTRIFLSGGTDGGTALWLNRVVTAGGREFEEAFQLSIADKATIDETASDIDQLRADRAAVAAARMKFLSGEAVKEVTRGGRKLVMHAVSLANFDEALAAIDREIAALVSVTSGTRRRRAMSVSFG